MKWSLLRYILIASTLFTLAFSKSSYNKFGYNYISGRERQLIVSKAQSIQSFLFPVTTRTKIYSSSSPSNHSSPSTSSTTKSSDQYDDSIDNLPISNQCKQFLNNYRVASSSHATWAHELEDAQGKIIYGVMKGNTEFLGDFDECVDLKVGSESNPWADYDNTDGQQPIFNGRYCTLVLSLKQGNNFTALQNKLKGFKAEKIGRLGLCTLTACSKDDLKKLIKSKFEDDWVEINLSGCDGPEEWQLATTPSIIRFTFGTLAILLLIGTILDRMVHNGVDNNNEDEIVKAFWMEMLISFSLTRNLRSILLEDQTPERSKFINVLKAVSMLLVFHGHGPLTIRFISLNSISRFYYMLSGPFQAVVNAGFLSVDFFLFTSAFITVKIVYPRFKELYERRASLSSFLSNIAFVLGYRYMRIAPALIFLMMMHIWSENLIAGPYWSEHVDKYLRPCRSQWLPNLLMLTNVLPWNPEEPNCAFHSWYLGLDMQLFIFGLFFFIVLGAIKPKLAISINIFMLSLSILAKGVATYYFNYPPTVLFGNREREYLYFSHIYTKPWFRADPYMIGLLFGYYTRGNGQTLKLTQMTKIATHIIILGIMWYILKVPFNYHDVDSYSNNLGIAAFGALHRAVWSLCLGWIFYSSYANDFPLLITISKWHIWEVLSNVSYQFFLFHPLAYFIFFGTNRSHFSTGQLPLYFVGVGIFFFLLLSTLILPAIVELPFSNMMKVIKNRVTGTKVKKIQ